ncbi:energy-coupling factor transporter transmembrane component T family protein [Humidisolicoccus flavus]|uniref:energy-coupling factor transporter transmembrane component T family protein n=1 Tax=Humidisolicoccus flavus TaxID=3111414 RepID=UPI00325002C8
MTEPQPGFLAKVNPVTPFAAAILYSLPMLTTIDRVSALVALGIWLIVFFALGVGPRTIVRRSWPLFIAAPLSAVSMLLYAEPGGQEYAGFWLARITDNSIELAIAVGVRVLAIGVPTLVLLVGVDPTRLADGLAQVAKLPERFVLGALAGIRLFSVFSEDWKSMARARRARGLGDSGVVRRFFTMAFALLVLAIRRGGSLATAMEARGFGAGPRTWARASTLTWRDTVAIFGTVAIAAIAIGIAIVLGSYRLVGT